jgi:hypothetical protein
LTKRAGRFCFKIVNQNITAKLKINLQKHKKHNQDDPSKKFKKKKRISGR